MVINETDLRTLVERIMELTLEFNESSKEEVLLVLSGNDYSSLKKALASYKCDSSNITVLASKKHIEDEQLGKMICSKAKSIVTSEKVLHDALNFDRIVYLTMPRDVLAKCALCIPDVIESKLFDKAISEGIPVTLARNSLAPFTGKEPESYVKRILEYIQILLEYGINIELDPN